MGIIFRLWLCEKKEFLLVKNFYLSGDSDRRWVSCSYFFGEFLKVVSVPTIYSIFLAWILLGMSLFIIVNVYLYSLQKKKKKNQVRIYFIFHSIFYWTKCLQRTNACNPNLCSTWMSKILDFISVPWIVLNRCSKPCFLSKPFLKNF